MTAEAVSAGLGRMLSPARIAHLGASESGVYPSEIFKSLLGSKAEVYPVNPNRETVHGRPCYKSLDLVPGPVDLVLVTLPKGLVPKAVADCVAAGVGAVCIISSGFAEEGEAGAALQREIEAFKDRILILGPNCAGFANLTEGLAVTRLSCPLSQGGLSFVSQSGALMMALHGSFHERGAGLRYLVSVGNQAGLRAEDLLLHFASDPGTKVSAAFLEGLKDGPAFIEALEAHKLARKPLVLVKSGRTSVGQRLAATHTAAVAGESRVFEALCRQYGVVLVDDFDELIETALLLERLPPGALAHCAFVTQSGGLGSLTGDLAKLAGLEPEAYPPDLVTALREASLVPQDQTVLNPVDLRGDNMRGPAMAKALEPFLASSWPSLIVLLFAKNPTRPVEAETAAAILEAATRAKPIVVVWAGLVSPPSPEGTSAVRLLAQGGIPVFSQSKDAMTALGRVRAYHGWRAAHDAAEGGSHAGL